MSAYHDRQVARILDVRPDYFHKIKITSDKGETHWMDIPLDAVYKIADVLSKLED